MFISMETTIYQRLTMLIKHSGLTDTDFGLKIGASRQEINRWQNGVKMPIPIISKMFEVYPEFSANWFLTGAGNMLNEFDEAGRIVTKKVCNDPGCLAEIESLEKQVTELQAETRQLQATIIFLQQEKINRIEKGQ